MGISRLLEVTGQKLNSIDRVEKYYLILYEKKKRQLLLSKNGLMIMEIRDSNQTRFDVILELPYEDITRLTVEKDHLVVIVDAKDRTYRFISFTGITASAIEEDLKGFIAPLDYPQLG